MIHLHTRAFCDECGMPATVQVGVVFFCDFCNPEVPCETGNAPAASSSAPSPRALPLAQSNSGIPRGARERARGPGPSLVTGVSGNRPNAGGEHEEVAPLSNDELGKSAACDSTSLIAADLIVDEKHSGTAPGACGPEGEGLGVTNSSSCGGVKESPASIPEYNGVKSPALLTAHGLSGTSCPLSRSEVGPQDSNPMHPAKTWPPASETCGATSPPAVAPPFSSEVPAGWSPGDRQAVAASVSTADAATVDLVSAFGIDVDAEIGALEALWARAARNARAFRVADAISSFPTVKSKSVNTGA